MNTDTINTAIRIAQALEEFDAPGPKQPPRTNRYVVVRGDRSGVFCGLLERQDGITVELTECRHIWYWDGASATDELAVRGTSKPENCKFTAPAPRVQILDAVTVLDCTDEAAESLRGVKSWTQFK